MTDIRLKRHPLRFYTSLTLATVALVSMATALIFIYADSDSVEREKMMPELLILFSIALYILSGYSWYQYFKNIPIIRITDTEIFFNHIAYPLDSITELQLTGKQPFRYIIRFPMEATTITFSDATTRYIFDDMYVNTWQVKLFLQQKLIEKIESPVFIAEKSDVPEISNTTIFHTYKGSLLLSLRGISFFVITLFLLYSIVSKPTISLVCIMSLFLLFWTWGHTRLMHFFMVSEQLLVVRNHILFWQKKIVSIEDIKEVVFETQGKMPNCLRIITKDFRSTLYPASTLLNKDWFALQNQLTSYGILVRNECVQTL